MPAPRHFLHVTIGHDDGAQPAAVAPFEISYRRINGFHDAVVVEVEGDGPRVLAEEIRDTSFFLPHLTLAHAREAGSSDALRAALLPLREIELGTQLVDEVVLCRVPVSRGRILEPWTVLKRASLRR